MMDEDVLPKHHPLRQYLSEVDLDDHEDSPTPGFSSVSSTPIIEDLSGKTREYSRFILNLADDLRLHLSQNLMDESHKDIIRDHDGTTILSKCTIMHIALIPLILIGLWQTSFTAYRWLSLVATCLVVPSFFAIFWLLWIRKYLSNIRHTVTINKAQSRACIAFFQELHIHCTVDSPEFDPDHPIHRLLLKFWYQLRRHNLELIDLCLQVKQTIPPDALLLCNLPMSNLLFIREQIMDDDHEILLSSCKMFRELAEALTLELSDQFYCLFCFVPVTHILVWIKAWISVRQWSGIAHSLNRQLLSFNQVRKAIECGHLTLNKKRYAMRYDNATEDGKPANAVARKLLLHLFAAVIKTQEFLSVFNSIDSSSCEEQIAVILSYIKLQLESSQLYHSELEHVVRGTGDAPSDTLLADDVETTVLTDSREKTHTQTPAADIAPEDDVVEDIATGNGDQPVGEDQCAPLMSTMMPLHASVLNELRLAIADRRAEMQQREHMALQKRFRSNISPDPEVPTTISQRRLESVVQAKSTAAPTTDVSTHDHTLDRFFSSTNSVAVLPESRHAHPWNIRSAVTKRSQLFRRTHMPLRQAPFVKPSPRVMNPLSGPAFAASLLAQRRAIGYEEEQSFVAIGDGPKEDMCVIYDSESRGPILESTYS